MKPIYDLVELAISDDQPIASLLRSGAAVITAKAEQGWEVIHIDRTDRTLAILFRRLQ